MAAASPPLQVPVEQHEDEIELRPLVTNRDHDGHDPSARPNEPSIKESNSHEIQEPVVRYRKTPLWLTAIYLVTLIVPWILTCVLDARPLTSSTYHDQRGRVDRRQYLSFWGLLSFINALNSISGILTVPVTTTVLAYAAVAYTQKQDGNHKLSISQLFALSDRGWTDMKTLWHSHREGRSSSMLWLGALLVLIGAIQQPLQTVLVTIEPIVAMSCTDIPVGGPCHSQATIAGYDADPWAMALVEHGLIVQDASNALVTLDNTQPQEHLWLDNPHEDDGRRSWDDPSAQSRLYYYGHHNGVKQFPGATYFVSSLSNGAQTGVLREHSLRLNSSVTCENVTRANLPMTCPGARPLDVRLERSNLNISICVPGKFDMYPWTLSRNRQDIREEIFIDFQFQNPPLIGAGYDFRDFTMHCKASTSRGYFQLGNIMNNNVYGPLLDRWPDQKTIERDTNDYVVGDSYSERPTEMDTRNVTEDRLTQYFAHAPTDPFGIDHMSISGPLMMAAEALFGNTSSLQFLYNETTQTSPKDILQAMCTHGNLPFSQLTGVAIFSPDPRTSCYNVENDDFDNDDDANWRIDGVVGSFIQQFRETDDANDLLDMSMFVVNRASLLKTVAGTGPLDARRIYTSPGTLFAKPTKALSSTIIISLMIAVQTTGLITAVCYSRRAPTWTATLDSMAVARIARAMNDEDILPLGPVTREDRDRLKQMDALVGLVATCESTDTFRSSTEEASVAGSHGAVSPLELGNRDLQLGLGASGVIDKSHAPARKKNKWLSAGGKKNQENTV